MSKSAILLSSIDSFYADSNHGDTLLSILNKRNKISLRQIEWFICSHSKKHNTTFTSRDGRLFTVHCAYKSSLDGYSKRYFDPFCRTSKIRYQIPGTDTVIQTTHAQLNFIRWVIKTGIYDYIEANRETLFKK